MYGRDRTRRVNEVHLHHHIHSHGTRYEVRVRRRCWALINCVLYPVGLVDSFSCADLWRARSFVCAQVDESHKMKLQSEIDGGALIRSRACSQRCAADLMCACCALIGHAKILQYMIAKNLPSEAVERFRNDRTDHRVDLDGFR